MRPGARARLHKLSIYDHWGGPRILKAVLISGPELPFPALAGLFDTYDLGGFGLLAGSGRLRPALAGPGRIRTPLFGLSEARRSG